MSFVLDLAIIAIIAITIYFAAKNGFVKTAISAVSFILAIILTVMFANPFAEYLKTTSVAETIETAVEDAISDALVGSTIGIDGLLNGESEKFNKMLELAKIDSEELSTWYKYNVVEYSSGESALASRIAQPLTDIVTKIIAIIVLFILSLILIAIVARVLNLVAKLPIIRTANKLLGVLLGAVLALLRVTLFCFVMGILIRHADFLGSDFLAGLDVNKTVLFKFFGELDIFSFFI